MATKGKPAAVMGSLVNLKNVATHKSIALTIHIPAEAAQEVLAAFGWPTMVDPVPVAVARLEEAAALAQPAPNDVLQTLEETSDKANRKLAASINAKTRHLKAMDEAMRQELLKLGTAIIDRPAAPTRLRHWSEMPPAEQTGVIRNEKNFWDFALVSDADEARDYIRLVCEVKSCADILPGTEAAAKWAELQVRYGNWLRERRGAA